MRFRNPLESGRRIADDDAAVWRRIKRNVEGALDAVLADGSPDWRTRLEAQRQLLTEAYGKPVQPTEELADRKTQIMVVRPPRD